MRGDRPTLLVHCFIAGSAQRRHRIRWNPFNLPHQVEVVYDLYDEQILARNVTAFNVELSPASTTLYYTGKEKLIDTLK